MQKGAVTQQNLVLQVLITRTLSARRFVKKQTMMQQPERVMMGLGLTLHVGIQMGLLIPDLFCQQSIRKVHLDHAMPFSLGSQSSRSEKLSVQFAQVLSERHAG